MKETNCGGMFNLWRKIKIPFFILLVKPGQMTQNKTWMNFFFLLQYRERNKRKKKKKWKRKKLKLRIKIKKIKKEEKNTI